MQQRKLFISYAYQDQAAVRPLISALGELRIPLRDDVVSLRLGKQRALLERAVKEASALLVYLTPLATAAKSIHQEVRWAAEVQHIRADYRLLIVAGGLDRAAAEHVFGAFNREKMVFIDGREGDVVSRVASVLLSSNDLLPQSSLLVDDDARPESLSTPDEGREDDLDASDLFINDRVDDRVDSEAPKPRDERREGMGSSFPSGENGRGHGEGRARSGGVHAHGSPAPAGAGSELPEPLSLSSVLSNRENTERDPSDGRIPPSRPHRRERGKPVLDADALPPLSGLELLSSEGAADAADGVNPDEMNAPLVPLDPGDLASAPLAALVPDDDDDDAYTVVIEDPEGEDDLPVEQEEPSSHVRELYIGLKPSHMETGDSMPEPHASSLQAGVHLEGTLHLRDPRMDVPVEASFTLESVAPHRLLEGLSRCLRALSRGPIRRTDLEEKHAGYSGLGRRLVERVLASAPRIAHSLARDESLETKVVVQWEGPPKHPAAHPALMLPWQAVAEALCGQVGCGALVRALPIPRPALEVGTFERLRVLVVSARPTERAMSHTDPRQSAAILDWIRTHLPEHVEVDVLGAATLPELRRRLDDAVKNKSIYHIVHLDLCAISPGGTGDVRLCMEDPDLREAPLDSLCTEYIEPSRMGAILRSGRVPLVVARLEELHRGPTGMSARAVAGLIEGGVDCVVHCPPAPTALEGCFLADFYARLAFGASIECAFAGALRRLKRDGGASSEPSIVRAVMATAVGLFANEGRMPRFESLKGEEVEDLLTTLHAAELEPPVLRVPLPSAADFPRALVRSRALVLRGEEGSGRTTLLREIAGWLRLVEGVERVVEVDVPLFADERTVLRRTALALAGEKEGAALFDEETDVLERKIVGMLAERPTMLALDTVDLRTPVMPGTSLDILRAAEERLHALLTRFAGRPGVWVIRAVAEDGARGAGLDGEKCPPWSHLLLGRLREDESARLLARFLADAGRLWDDYDDESLAYIIRVASGRPGMLKSLAWGLVTIGAEGTLASLSRLMERAQSDGMDEDEARRWARVLLHVERMSEEDQRVLSALAAFHCVAHVAAMARVLDISVERALTIGRSLKAAGLADSRGAYLFLHGDLLWALDRRRDDAARAVHRERWKSACSGLIQHLLEMRADAPAEAASGLESALPELMAFIHEVGRETVADDSGEESIAALGRLKALVQPLDCRPALDILDAVEADAEKAQDVSDAEKTWGDTLFGRLHQRVEVLQMEGKMDDAVEAARELVDRTREQYAYNFKANLHLGMAQFLLGQTLFAAHRVDEAVEPLEDARRRFMALALSGREQGLSMTAQTLGLLGQVLRAQGRIEEARSTFDEGLSLVNESEIHAELSYQCALLDLVPGKEDEARASLRAVREAFVALGDRERIEAVDRHLECLGEP